MCTRFKKGNLDDPRRRWNNNIQINFKRKTTASTRHRTVTSDGQM
jgi:hypothetical protein